MPETLTLGSLFDGSGGFPLGGLLCGITPIWASEIEPFPIRVTTKRLPQMKHYGDVSLMDGGEIEPVDIITFGSPCQDMSIAGRREGLDGRRSGLFYEAVRIIKEMRVKTNGQYPKYIVWENVPGAFSSNGGEDFRCVLESICKIADETVSVPPAPKWLHAGSIMGEGYSVSWRLLDAQHWGVPQRRKRIYLVADLNGGSAGEILFKSEGLSGYSAAGFEAWKRAARSTEGSTGEAGLFCLNDQGGNRMDVSEGVTGTLRAQDHGHTPAVMAAGFCTEHSARSRSIGYEEETSPTLRAGVVPAAIALEHHPTDSRIKIDSGNAVQTLTGRMGTGGNNVPLVMSHEGVAYGIDRATCNMGQGAKFDIAVKEELEPTMVARGPNAVAHPVYSTSKNSYHTEAEEDVANTLVATDYKDPPTVAGEPYYIVRRLTPTECARLQGFPDWWCSEIGTEEPTEEEITFWEEVFETHRRLVTKASKPKTRNQIVKWLKVPHLDSSEYKLWGNGVALPCVWFVLAGIVWAHEMHNKYL